MATAMTLLVGCGGGGGDDAPEASTMTFTPRATYRAMVTQGKFWNLAGSDNDPQSAGIAGRDKWTGTVSVSRRDVPDDFRTIATGCAGTDDHPLSNLVDVRMSLKRKWDGTRVEEAATFAFDDEYKPLCALLLDGNYWTWAQASALPVAATEAEMVGGIQLAGSAHPLSPTAAGAEFALAGLITLDPDSSDSAYLTFLHHVSGTAIPFSMFGENTQLRFRITADGRVIGFDYVRYGVLPTSPSSPVTLHLSSR